MIGSRKQRGFGWDARRAWTLVVLVPFWLIRTGLVDAATGVPPAEGGDGIIGGGPGLRLHVVEGTEKRPIAAAAVRATFPLAADLPRLETVNGKDGICDVRIPRPASTHILVMAQGYAWAEAAWESVGLPEEYQFELERAGRIGGIVLDQRGVPVPGARIRMIRGGGDWSEFGEAHRGHVELADEAGRWTCAHAPDRIEGIRFHVFHPDHAVGRFVVEADEGSSGGGLSGTRLRTGSAVMLLRQGLHVKGMVVDEEENPVEGARITGGSYPVWTPVDGRFELRHAPSGPLELIIEVACRGHEPVEFTVHEGVNAEQIIRLRRPLRIVGWVIDGGNGSPVKSFRVVRGRVHGDHHDWDEDHAQPGSAGSFAIELRGDGLPQAVKVEADGYYPAVSRAYPAEAEHQTELFELTPGTPLRGVVRDAAGRPVAGAEVGLALPRQPVILGPGGFLDRNRSKIVLSDDHGRFEFQPQWEAEAIYAAHELGFAEIRPVSTDMGLVTLALEPWSRIEGWLRSGASSRAGQLVALVRPESTGLFYHANRYAALTDEEGRFAMAGVPPGEHLVVRVVRGQPSHASKVVTEPGRTVRLELGGEGRLVTGKVRLRPSLAQEDWGGDHPGALRRAGHEHPWVLLFDTDGRFRVEDVPPGQYTLEVHYHEPDLSAAERSWCRGQLRTSVVVPAVEAGREADAVDLGEFDVPLRLDGGMRSVTADDR